MGSADAVPGGLVIYSSLYMCLVLSCAVVYTTTSAAVCAGRGERHGGGDLECSVDTAVKSSSSS